MVDEMSHEAVSHVPQGQVGSADVAHRIARRLLKHAIRVTDADRPCDAYLTKYLGSHIGHAGLWHELEEQPKVLDALDPSAVSQEAMASVTSLDHLPTSVLATTVAHAQLRNQDSTQRRLTRALAASRLGRSSVVVSDARLKWSSLRPVVPHLPLSGHSASITALTFATLPSGRLILASGSEDATVRLWDPMSGSAIGDPLADIPNPVTALSSGTTNSGRVLLASGHSDGSIGLWDPLSANLVLTLPRASRAPINGLRFTHLHDGRVVLASGGGDGIVRLWDPASAELLADKLAAHKWAVFAVEVSEQPPGYPVIISAAGGHGSVQLCPPSGHAETELVHTFVVGYPVLSLASLSGRAGMGVSLATAGDDRLRLWDVAIGKQIWSRSCDTGSFLTVTMMRTPQLQILAGGVDDGRLMIWSDPLSGGAQTEFVGHIGPVRALASATLPDTRVVLASGGADMAVRLWDPLSELSNDPAASVRDHGFRNGNGRPAAYLENNFDELSEPIVRRRADQQGHVRSIALTTASDGKRYLASGGSDGQVRLWDAASGKKLGAPLQGQAGSVRALCFATFEGGEIALAAGSGGGAVRAWSSVGAGGATDLAGHRSSVNTVVADRLSDGSVILVSGGNDGRLCAWDLGSMSRFNIRVPREKCSVIAVAIAPQPDGDITAARALGSGQLVVSNILSGNPIGEISCLNSGSFTALTFVELPGHGCMVVTGSSDGMIQLWDLRRLGLFCELANPQSKAITAVATLVRQDGTVLLAASSVDGSIVV